MFEKARHLLRTAWSTLLCVEVQDQVGHKKHEQATADPSKTYYHFGNEDQCSLVTVDINILCVFIAMRLKDFDLAIRAAKEAVSQVIRDKKIYTEEDKKYLRYYCRTLLEFVSTETEDDVFLDNRAIDVDFNDLRFERVRSNLKRSFPITRPA